MKKVIVTGFEKFGPYKFNPTEDIAKYFNGKIIPNSEIIGIVLPASYYGAFKLLDKAINEHKPNAIISLGLSLSVEKIVLEKKFKNVMYGKYVDAERLKPDHVAIIDGGPEILNPRSKNNTLAEMLRSKNIPAATSMDADTFICNSLGYLTTKKIVDEKLDISNIFIHIPWTMDYKGQVFLTTDKIYIEKEMIYKAVELLIKNV